MSDDKTKRRMALLMDEDEVPEVSPPRPMTPEEKKAAVEAYLKTDEGRAAVAREAAARADHWSSEQREPTSWAEAMGRVVDRARDTRRAARRHPSEREVRAQQRESEVINRAVREAAEAEARAEAERQRRAQTRPDYAERTPGGQPIVRDNSEHYRRLRENVRQQTTVRGNRRSDPALDVSFDDNGNPTSSLDSFLSDD